MLQKKNHIVSLLYFLGGLFFLYDHLDSTGYAQTGVSDNRVALPEGPGSVDGFGDNTEINLNMGAMSYSIGISVPQGVGAETPSLAFNYSSNSGNSLMGMGWDLSIPSIERATSKGLPQYILNDRFVVNGSMHLSQIRDGELSSGTEYTEYRAKKEGSFKSC